MNQIFEQKEYYEDYVMEKLAEEMLDNDPELKKEFEAKLSTDEEFKNNPRAILDFFYYKSPYPDKQLNVYPILRVDWKVDKFYVENFCNQCNLEGWLIIIETALGKILP